MVTSTMAYTGVDVGGMSWTALLLLLGGAVLLTVGTLYRRRPRRH